jgi:hypothetical protein
MKEIPPSGYRYSLLLQYIKKFDIFGLSTLVSSLVKVIELDCKDFI